MKEICICKSKFEKRLGYGILLTLTTVISISTITMIIESDSLYVRWGINEFNGGSYGEYCYKSLFGTGEYCRCYDICAGMESERPEFHNKIMFWLIGIIWSIVGFVVYAKQQKFKFKWCLKDGSES